MSSEISQLCLEALSPLAEQCAKNQEKDTALFVATRHFLKVRSLYVTCSKLGRPETVQRRHSEGQGDRSVVFSRDVLGYILEAGPSRFNMRSYSSSH